MNVHKCKKSRRWQLLVRDLLCLWVFIGAWVFAFWLVRFGTPQLDEPYQILNGMAGWQNTPFAPLTAVLTGWLQNSFGLDLLHFRYVGVICYGVTTGIVVLYVFHRFWQVTLWWGLGLLLGALDWRWTYGWDCYAWATLSLTTVLLLAYLNRRSLWLLLAMAVVTALSIAVRVPDVIFMVVAAVAIWRLDGSMPGRGRQALTYMLLSVTLFCVFALSMYGDASSYVEAWVTNRLTAHGPEVVGHFFSGFVYAAPAGLMVFAIAVLMKWVSEHRVSTAALWGFDALCALLAIFIIHWYPGFNYIQYIALGMVLWGCLWLWLEGQERQRWLAMMLAMLILTPCVGSNTGLAKALAIPVLPLMYVWLRGRMQPRLVNSYMVVGYIAMIFAGVEMAGRYTLEDYGLRKADTRIKTSRYAGVYTTLSRARTYAQVDSLMRGWTERGYTPVVYGRSLWQWAYLYGYYNRWYHHDWSDAGCYGNVTSPAYDRWFLDELKTTQRPVILVPPYQPVGHQVAEFLDTSCTREEYYQSPDFIVK